MGRRIIYKFSIVKRSFIVFSFTFACILISAAKLYASDIIIKSEPSNAIIYLRIPDSDKVHRIAKTPYRGKLDGLRQVVGGSDSFLIEIKKVGFKPYRLLLANPQSVDIKLKANLEIDNDIKFTQDYDLLIDDLFDVQKFVRTKDYQTAIKKLDQLDKKFPHFSIIDELRASIFYLKKDFKRSLSFYRSAFAKNSKNRDAYKMKNYLEKKFKLKKLIK